MRLVLLLLLVSTVGCAGSSPAPAMRPQPVRPAATAQAPGAPMRSLSRSVVHTVVADGLGVFLQRVELDDQPVMNGGKFHGFRIAALREPDFWAGVDLQPGDVVTGLNGFPIERPEQAQTAFESLDVASELRLTYDRDGKPRELVYAIVDDR